MQHVERILRMYQINPPEESRVAGLITLHSVPETSLTHARLDRTSEYQVGVSAQPPGFGRSQVSKNRIVCVARYVPNLRVQNVKEMTMATGTVKWFNPTKGYGFIQPQGGGKDVFVHISAVERAGLSTLNEGQTVQYEVVSNRGKESAENLKVG
jgi:CspA family cold shock protein